MYPYPPLEFGTRTHMCACALTAFLSFKICSQVLRVLRHDIMFYCLPPSSNESINHRKRIMETLQTVLLPAAASVPFLPELSYELWHLMHLFNAGTRKELYGNFQVSICTGLLHLLAQVIT